MFLGNYSGELNFALNLKPDLGKILKKLLSLNNRFGIGITNNDFINLIKKKKIVINKEC